MCVDRGVHRAATLLVEELVWNGRPTRFLAPDWCEVASRRNRSGKSVLPR